jgi:hypothetical protein
MDVTLLAAGLIVATLYLCISVLPQVIIDRKLDAARPAGVSSADYTKAPIDVRGTLLQALVGGAVLAGAYGTLRQLKRNIQDSREQRHIERQGR